MKSLASAETLEGILARLRALRPESVRLWGRMSAHQAVCHLSDSFEVPMGGKRAGMATGFFERTVMKYGALYVPMQWPKGTPTRPEIDQFGGGTPPAEFEADRGKLVAAIRRFCAAKPDFQWEVHPFFGAMTPRQWMRWGYLHTDHHLRQFGA
jgi:hypothetical protein